MHVIAVLRALEQLRDLIEARLDLLLLVVVVTRALLELFSLFLLVAFDQLFAEIASLSVQLFVSRNVKVL